MKYYNGSLGEFQFNDDEYEIRKHLSTGQDYIKYIGKSSKPIQPIGCIDFNWTFAGSKLLIFDFTDWDVSRVINMDYMFINCKFVENFIGIENWNTISLQSSVYMFYNCKCLKSLDITNWDLSSNKSMRYMFAFCKSMSFLNLMNCKIPFKKIIKIPFIMYGCEELFSFRKQCKKFTVGVVGMGKENLLNLNSLPETMINTPDEELEGSHISKLLTDTIYLNNLTENYKDYPNPIYMPNKKRTNKNKHK